ncbi:MAG: hypothetical protein AABW73_01265 [Nanoarchaeota archaeon]
MTSRLDSVKRIKRCSSLTFALSSLGLASSLGFWVFGGPDRPKTMGYDHYRLLVNYRNGLQSQLWSLGTNNVREELKIYQEPLAAKFDETIKKLDQEINLSSKEESVITYKNDRREHDNNPLHQALMGTFGALTLLGYASYKIAERRESAIYDEGAIRFREIIKEKPTQESKGEWDH